MAPRAIGPVGPKWGAVQSARPFFPSKGRPDSLSRLRPTPINHYAVLGLDRDCSAEQIRAAYRILAKRHHPDRNGGAPESVVRTQELNLAYETLGDPERRLAYDAELAEAGRRPRVTRTGRFDRQVKQDVLLRIDEFFRGTTLEVRVNDPGNPGGPESYDLEIPPGTAPGTRFRIEREAAAGGGSVQVRLRARPDLRFKVRGSDLRCDLRIHARRAAEGGSESVRGPLGNYLRVAIPRGVARGELIRLEGEGLPGGRGGRGDLLVRVVYQPEVRIRRRAG